MSISGVMQQALDATGRLEGLPGMLLPDVPLFLDRPGVSLSSLTVNLWAAGTFAVVGHRRGLVSDDHYPAGGFRTCGDTHLLVQDGFNCGPMDPGTNPVRGWKTQSSFRLRFGGVSHGPQGWVQRTAGGEPTHTFLFGMYGHGNGWEPSPFYLVWTLPPGSWTPTLTLIFRTSDGDVNFLRIPAEASVAALELDLRVDLAARTASAFVNSHPVTPTFDHPPTAGALADNFDWPFSLGKFEWAVNSTTFPAPVLDFTTRTLWYEGDGGFEFRLRPDKARPMSYPGGPSLPLVYAQCSEATRWAVAVHRTQGEQDQAVGRIRMTDLDIQGVYANPVLVVRCLNDKLRLEGVRVTGGSCGLSMHSPGGTIYPVTLEHCNFVGQYGYNLRGHRTHLAVRDTVLGYALEGVTHTRGGVAHLQNVFVAPPGPPAARFAFRQEGGTGWYQNCLVNYEYPGPPFMADVLPVSWDVPNDRTTVVAEWCNRGMCHSTIGVRDNHPGYAGPITARLDGADLSPR